MPLVAADIVQQAMSAINAEKEVPSGIVGFNDDGTEKPGKLTGKAATPAFKKDTDTEQIIVKAVVDAIIAALAAGVTVNMTGGTMAYAPAGTLIGVGGGIPGPVNTLLVPLMGPLTSVTGTTAKIS